MATEDDGAEPEPEPIDVPSFAAIHELVVCELRDRASEVPLRVADNIGWSVADKLFASYDDLPMEDWKLDFYVAPVA